MEFMGLAKFYGNKADSIKRCLLAIYCVPSIRLDTENSCSKYSLRTYAICQAISSFLGSQQ